MPSTRSFSASNWPSKKVRQTFLDFFAEREHKIVPSSSLVPGDDPTLLFTNAGMVQFKDMFLGTGRRPYKRAVDAQKCMRVAGKHNDLDDVGRDDSHHTFFEMLGNWSFGDYYKRETIQWAWELLTGVWGLPKDRLWATVFEDQRREIPRDDEAAEIWAQQPGFNSDQILFFGREQNFWEMAEIGPCGPDSEIHFDLGEAYCKKKGVTGHVCRVNGDCSRFLELWNLVFIQYNRLSPAELHPLPEKHVDTGMGFERIVSVLQNVDSNYKTDLFAPMLDQIQSLTGHSQQERSNWITPYRVIADHSRAAAFLIADGVVPGNIGRNYVCRMVIRRASRFGSELGFDQPFLARIADLVVEQYGDFYQELSRNRNAILQTIKEEEERFHRTIDQGLARLEQQLARIQSGGGSFLPGEEAFDLYATYGLPLEISRDVAREKNLEVEVESFNHAMEAHRFASGAGKIQESMAPAKADLYQKIFLDLRRKGDLSASGVTYDPYKEGKLSGQLLVLVRAGELIEQALPGDQIEVVVPATNFYIESGGQVSDMGLIRSLDGQEWVIEITNVSQPIDGLILHMGTVKIGKPRVGDGSVVEIDRSRRQDIMRNHTATHLLHAALQKVLGGHARQAGSLVAADRLRFDFTHSKAMTKEQIEEVERYVGEAILTNYELDIEYMRQEEAIHGGAMALFGETYGEVVRTIKIGEDDRLSFELCGGTHVQRTGIIGPFIILSEGSVAAGIRRIEALTGRAAVELINRQRAILSRLSRQLDTSEDALEERIASLIEGQNRLQKEFDELKYQLALADYRALAPEQIEAVTVLRGMIPGVNMETLRQLTDLFRNEYPSGIAVLGSVHAGRALVVACITQDLVERGLDASDLVKTVAESVGGSGGGRPTLAQAGGGQAKKLPEGLARVEAWVRNRLT